MSKTFKKSMIAVVVTVAAALSVGSLAFACTTQQGDSKWCDTNDQAARTIARPASVCQYSTNANPSKQFDLILGHTGTDLHACMVQDFVIVKAVTSSSTGAIANTTGTVGSTAPTGVFSLCFREKGGWTATTGPLVTVT